ncbi:MAG: DUF364 domain-containing protein [Coriobacteriales bacterium]|jgi:uncharacterized protein (DUF4213/DUF364 family)|nr:DUF364 domain-containing protein [Coriobacteriales bacterium]
MMSAKRSWELYDRLIDGVPRGIGVVAWSLGRRWSYVASEEGIGIAMTVSGGVGLGKGADFLGGSAAFANKLDLREMAAYAKSWRFEEASIGVAALNAWYNIGAHNPGLAECFKQVSPADSPTPKLANGDPVIRRQGEIISAEIERMFGRKVAVVGHFHHLEAYAEHCELTILERSPSNGDLPDPASEYVLPEQDLVIITGTAATNKTLPRLLELSQSARTVIVGPSAVCSEILFDYGVALVGGAVVTDVDAARARLIHGVQLPFGDGVEMVQFRRS